MKPGAFLNQVQHGRIVRAIAEAESKTSGEIRVFVSRRLAEDPVAEATRHFHNLGMVKTREHNGILIFIAPASRNFAVIGDQAIHEKCGQEFWARLATEMADLFKQGDFTAGLVKGVETAGLLLAEHFPRKSNDVNELPDRVEQD